MFKKFWSKIKKFGHSPTLIAYYRKDYRQTFWRKTGHALMVRDYKRDHISGGISNFKIDLFCVHIPKYPSEEKEFVLN